MYVRTCHRNSINECTTTYDTYRGTMGIFFFSEYSLVWDKLWRQLGNNWLAEFYGINLFIHKDPKNNWRVPLKIQNFAHFSLVSLSVYTRSRRGAERIGQGKGRWSRPLKMALERSDSTEKFQFWESHTEAEKKKAPDWPNKKKNDYIYIYLWALRMARMICCCVDFCECTLALGMD